MVELTKAQKRKLRELDAKAHEAELGRALRALFSTFQRWDRGELDSFDMSDAVHRFHDGTAREIWKRHDGYFPDLSVARAIAEGLIDRAAVPPDLLALLAPDIARYEARDTT